MSFVVLGILSVLCVRNHKTAVPGYATTRYAGNNPKAGCRERVGEGGGGGGPAGVLDRLPCQEAAPRSTGRACSPMLVNETICS